MVGVGEVRVLERRVGTESVTSYDIRGEVPALETWRDRQCFFVF